MATLRITNLTGSPVSISDVGILIPAASFDDFTSPGLIRALATSADLRALVLAGTLSLSDGTNPVTLYDLIRYWMGAGFEYPPSDVLTNERWWLIQQNAGLTTLNNVGFTTAPTTTGTATVLGTATAQFINYNSAGAVGSQAGWIATAFLQTQLRFRPIYKAFMRTGPVITDVRYWFGLFSATPAAADDPAINGMGFRYSTAVDGTAFWRCWTNDGVGGGTVTVTTVPFTADTTYILSIMISPDGTQIFFFINDVLVATHTTDLPGATVNLGHVERITTIGAGGAKDIRISKVALSQRAA